MTAHVARRLIWNDTRALFPTWAAAAAVTLAGGITAASVEEIAYVFGSFALGAQSVGHEYGHRTLATLLVQPLDRRHIYAVKQTVLAVLLLALAAVASVGSDDFGRLGWDRTLVITLPPLGAMLFGPLVTMMSRHQLGGTLFTAVPAGVVLVVAQWIAYRRYGETAAADQLVQTLWFSAMLVMAPTAGILGWRKFQTLEVIDGPGAPIQLPRLFRRRATLRVHHRLWHHVSRELHLQQIAFVTAALFALGAAWGLAQAARGILDDDVVTMLATIYAPSLALVIGAVASAEERQLGTLEAQLMLPSPKWQLWAVKASVALGLAVALGAVLPALLLSVASSSGDAWMFLATVSVPVLAVASGGLYVSSISASAVRALAIAAPAAVATMVFAHNVALAAGGFDGAAHRLGGGRLFGFGETTILIALLLALGLVNHRTLERSPARIARQVAALLAVVAGGVLVG